MVRWLGVLNRGQVVRALEATLGDCYGGTGGLEVLGSVSPKSKRETAEAKTSRQEDACAVLARARRASLQLSPICSRQMAELREIRALKTPTVWRLAD